MSILGWRSWSTILLLFLSGCTFKLPVALTDLQNLKETASEVARETPTMAVTLHPDGLGWQVFLNQSVTRRIETEADEYWQYRLYDLSGRSSPGRPENYDDVCGPLLLTTPFLAHMNIAEPPYWTRWDRWASSCRMTSANSLSVLHGRRLFRDYSNSRVEPVTDGFLLLVWDSPGHSSIHAKIPLDNNTKATGTAVRLRWLAEVIRRTARPPVIQPSGTVELHLVQREQTVLRKRLAVSGADVVASLNDERILSVSAEHWPREFVVRIDQDLAPLTRDEQADLVQHAVGALNRLTVPVVLRGQELERWRADQVRFHYPQFSDLPSVDAAHAIGATLLLHLEITQPYPQARVLTMHMASIETGELLATLTTGGHESQWNSIVDMGMRELGFLLQHQLDQRPGRPNSMRPTLMGREQP